MIILWFNAEHIVSTQQVLLTEIINWIPICTKDRLVGSCSELGKKLQNNWNLNIEVTIVQKINSNDLDLVKLEKVYKYLKSL